MQCRTLADGAVSVTEVTPRFDAVCDVCVVGLGTAGAVAAIAAALQGVSVIGIERTAGVGGVAVAGIWDYYYGTPGGIPTALLEDCSRRMTTGYYASSGGHAIRWESIPGIVKSTVLGERLESSGCRVMTECRLVGVLTEGDRVCGVQVFDGTRTLLIGSRVVIDCADGAACRLAGCTMEGGRPSDGHTMKFSHIYTRTDGDYARFSIRQAAFPEADTAADYAASLLGAAEDMAQESGTRILGEGDLYGLREVPHVVTEDTRTLADVAAGTPVREPLFFGFGPADNTNMDSWMESDILKDWKVLLGSHRFGFTSGIPKGAVIPKGVDGILVAGKAAGLSRDLMSAMRMKLDVEKCGEATGVLAALSCRHNCGVREVDYEELRAVLARDGCFDPAADWGFCDLNQPLERQWQPYVFPQTEEEWRTALASTEPGQAIWRLRDHCPAPLRERLVQWMQEDDRLLAENSAIALGIQGDRRCLPLLRDIAAKPPVRHAYTVPHLYSPYDIGTTVFCNAVKAVCLLERLGDDTDLPLLRRLAAGDDTELASFAKAAIRRLTE